MHHIGKYKPIELIGKGTFGQVFKATSNDSKTHVALKLIDLTKCSEKDQEHVQHESEVHQRLRHPNIVKFIESFTYSEGNKLCIAMEYCEMGNLRTLVEQRNGLKEEDCIGVLLQIIEGLKYLHEQNICHRDVKTTNILLQPGDGEKFIVKIGDFGVAKFMDKISVQTMFVGSPYFMSPEMISGKPYDKRTDIWSLGCVVYEMATTEVPYGATCKTQSELEKRVVEDEVTLTNIQYCEHMKTLIRNMMKKDPAGRLDINGVIERVKQDIHCPKNATVEGYPEISDEHQPLSAKTPFSKTWTPGAKSQIASLSASSVSNSNTGFETGEPCKPGTAKVKTTVLMSQDEEEFYEKAKQLEIVIHRKLRAGGMDADNIMKKIKVAIDQTKDMKGSNDFLTQMEKIFLSNKATFERCKPDLNALWGYRSNLLTKSYKMAWSEK